MAYKVKKVSDCCQANYKIEKEDEFKVAFCQKCKNRCFIVKKLDYSKEKMEDVLYEEAKKIVIQNKKGDATFLMKKLHIGYARCARFIDMLEEEGIVGPSNGAKPREVLKEKDD